MENKDQQNSVMFEAPSAESFENEEKRFHVMPEKFLPKVKLTQLKLNIKIQDKPFQFLSILKTYFCFSFYI